MATVTGEVYRGSVLPRQMDVGVPSPPPPSSSSNDGLIHVLAVDDSRTDRLVIERLLKISCCKVTTVDSGIRALQYLGLDGDNTSVGFNDLKVNLIMTDYSMPGMTGYELLKRIKESSVFRKIPVVIMSSENILTQIDRCLEEGAEDYLVKPVKLDDVKRVTNDAKRLTNFLMRGDGDESRRVVKRKMEDDIFSFSSSSSSSEPASPELPSDEPSSIDCVSKKLKL